MTDKLSRRALLSAAGTVGVGAAFAVAGCNPAAGPTKALTLLNVSYDPTRELYKAINAAFATEWAAKNAGQTPTIEQSHGGSGGQARKVIDGLQADVVTLALAADIDAIAEKAQLLPVDWQTRLPNNSAPYTSTIVFLVKKGNPHGVKDWGDLLKPGIGVVTPNPKTSGGARWNYIAAWAWALRQPGGSPATAQTFIQKLLGQVPVLDAGARASTLTFAQRGIGDVLLAWENEAHLAFDEFGADKFEIVAPSFSVLAEPPVAVIDKNVDAHGTRSLAEAYLQFLYTPAAQDIIAKNFYRPRDSAAAKKYASQFPNIPMITIDDPLLGGWKKVQAEHFADGGIFDKIYAPSVK
jgi:sulfate transport system substrate-binding protein